MISKKLWGYLLKTGFIPQNMWIDCFKDGRKKCRCAFAAPVETERTERYDHIDLYVDLAADNDQALIKSISDFYHDIGEMSKELMVYKGGEGNMLDAAECTLKSIDEVPENARHLAGTYADSLFSLSMDKISSLSDDIKPIEEKYLSDYDLSYEELSKWYEKQTQKQ